MESITVVRCPACGYDGNNPFFRFCGICGTALPKEKEARPAPARARTAKDAPLTINSFSILGLQEDPTLEDAIREAGAPPPEASSSQPHVPVEAARYAGYLLDEEEDAGSPRWRLYVVSAALVIGIVVLGWQWERDRSSLTLLAAAINPPRNTAPAVPENVAQNVPASVPAPTPVAAAAPSPAAEVPAPSEKPVTPSAQAIPENQTTPVIPAAAPAKPEASDPAKSAAPAPVAEPVQPQDRPVAVKSSPAPEAAPTVAAPAQAASFSGADAARLLEEGQKFLYGDGATPDCGRALQDLRQAARINAEAASLLGTMYASGHCVSKNLPPAYHWYARALHRDPTNMRYQSDLEVIWNQMTPAEKQAAMRIAP